MALSGSFLTNGYYSSSKGDYIYLEFSWSATQSIAGNTSTIAWSLKGKRTASGYVNAGGFKVVIDGETVYNKSTDYRIELRNGTVVASGTKTVTHSGDGTKSFAVSVQGAIYEYSVNCSGSKTYTLDTIPRKSELSASNGTLGTAQTLTVTKKASSFTHTITYSCGSASGTICTKSSSTSISWTPPNDLASQAPNGNSVSVKLTITTYSGSTSVGSSAVSISCTIPNNSTFVPVLLPTITDAMGYYSTYSAFIQGQSKLKIDITTYGAYGATISSVKTEFEGASYTGTTVTSNTIKNSGTLAVKITVTDSRGRTSVANSSITVLAYKYPEITSLTATRCNADGTANPAGSYLLAKFSAKIYALNNKNTATYYIGYKKPSEENHTAVNLTNLKGVYTVNSSYVIPAETNYSYTVIFTAIDAFGQGRTTTTGSTVKKVWSALKKNGEIVGMAVGKIAEYENTFDIGFPVKFSGGGACVVEEGEANGWTYRKWDSGIMECWKIVHVSTAIDNLWSGSGLYYGSTTMSRQTYPFPFVSKPVENVTLQSGANAGWVIASSDGYGVNGGYASAIYNIMRPSMVSTVGDYYFSFYCIGRLK